jgi:hypothetical protein
MAYTLIVEKSEARVLFIKDASVPLLLDALWPTVAYNYVLYPLVIPSEAILREPWNYVLQGPTFVAKPYPYVENAKENAHRANMLVQLAKATNRHRRMVVKEDLLGQDLVYALKTSEAQRFLADTSQPPAMFPWLSQEAAFDSMTLAEAANHIIFRHTQAQQILIYTERRRREFTRRILSLGMQELATVQNELTDYERRG